LKEKKKNPFFFPLFHFSTSIVGGKEAKVSMPPKEAPGGAPPALTVTPITCSYEELLLQEPHVLEAVEKVRRSRKEGGRKSGGGHRMPQN